MTQEEKAKAYDEALEKAKEIKSKILYSHLSTESCKAVSEYIDTIIPELRESEDERIRKELVYFIQKEKEYMESQVKPENSPKLRFFIDALAYLEKQKEHKPNYCHHEVDETDWDEVYRKAYYDGWNNCNMQHSQLKAMQKPAEWSEEDEKMRENLLYLMLENNSQDSWEGAYEWLKSLRPSWKPSEEKLSALGSYVEELQARATAAVGGWNKFDALIDLYNDLKKL